MQVSREALEGLIRSGEVDTVVMAFPDLQGRLVGKRTTGRFFLDKVADDGTENCDYLIACDMDDNPVDGYRFTSYEQGYGDMLARADWDTVRLIPWVDRTAMIFCDLYDVTTGELIEVAPRTMLRRQVEAAAELGFVPMVASEIEFFLFKDTYDEAHEKGYRDLRPHSPWIEDYHVLQTTKDEYILGQIRRADRILDVLLHHLDDLGELGMPDPDPRRDRQALRVLIGADRGIDELVGDGVGDLFAVILGDDLQHHVDRGGAAGGGHAVAIHDENRFRQLHLLELLKEAVLVFPVDGCTLAIEKAGLGDRVGAGAEPADGCAAPRLAPQPVEDRLGGRLLNVDAAADKHGVLALDLAEAHVEFEGGAVRAGALDPALAGEHPGIGVAPEDAVGDPERFDSAREGQHGESVEKQEHEPPVAILSFSLPAAA